MRPLFLSICICGSLYAQVTPIGKEAAAPALSGRPEPAVERTRADGKCLIEGIVVDALTGEPVKNAKLWLRPLVSRSNASYAAIGDASGRFAIHAIEPGRYDLFAFHEGYIIRGYVPDASGGNVALTLEQGRPLTGLRFNMMPQGVIAGRILDGGGEPLGHVMVRLLTLRHVNGKRRLIPGSRESTNDLGEYRFSGLTRGRYVISAAYQSDEIFQTWQDKPTRSQGGRLLEEERYVPTYYPGTTDPNAASQIQVTPGSSLSGITITLVRARAVTLKGRLRVGAENPLVAKPRLALIPRNAGLIDSAHVFGRVVDAEGNFEIRGVVEGFYWLRADYSKGPGQQYHARVPLDVGRSDLGALELNLRPAAELEGVIEIEGDASGLRADALGLLLTPKSNMSDTAVARLNPDMTFRIGNIGPDAYDVTLQGQPNRFYLRSIHLGDQDVTETGLDFTQRSPVGRIKVVLGTDGAQIDGTVLGTRNDNENENEVGAAVILVPDARNGASASVLQVRHADRKGRFSINGVAPGEYTICAWGETDSDPDLGPDFVRQRLGTGKHVNVQPHARLTVELKVSGS